MGGQSETVLVTFVELMYSSKAVISDELIGPLSLS